MKSAGFARTALLWLVGIVAVSAIGGGVTLTLASVVPSMPESLMPPADELVGSPFTSYLIPGLILLFVVGGLHSVAFVLLLRRRRSALLVVTISGYALVIWIFVQMMIISFSALQVIYAVFGLLEIGLVLLELGIVPLRRSPVRLAADDGSPRPADSDGA